MVRLLLSCWVVFVAGCGSRAVRYEREPDGKPASAAIVFVPGFYGSALADARTGERFFLSAWAAFFGSTPLALTEPDLGVVGAKQLVPDGVLESIRIVPGIYGSNVYGDALDFLRDVAGDRAEVIPFDYDWRGDLHETVQRLDGVVRKLRESGTTKIIVVAHSMGGLVTAYYERYGAESPVTADDRHVSPPRLAAVALLGVPFGGAMTAFRNLQFGTSLGPAKTPLAQASLATFPSMYHLVPRGESGVYFNGALRPLNEAIHRFELWDRHGLGLQRRPLPEGGPLRERRARAQARYLERAEQFLDRIQAPASTALATPTLVFVGKGRPTFTKAVWSGNNLGDSGTWIFSEETLARRLASTAPNAFSLSGDGDGTVPASSAKPPAGLQTRFDARVLETTAHHEEMFGDDQLQASLRVFLDKALRTPSP